MINPNEILRLLMQGLAFTLVATLWFIAILVWLILRARERRRIQSRLNLAPGDHEERILRLWHDGKLAEAAVPGHTRPSLMQRLRWIGEDAGWNVSMPRVLVWFISLVVLVAALLYIVTGKWLISVIAVVAMAIAFRVIVGRAINNRSAIFEKQLVDSLDLGARSLRAGHPLTGAFQLMAQEIEAPLGPIYADVCEQEALGISLQQGLLKAAERTRSPDMKIFAASVVIQLRSGGNLADMMDRVAWVIRERMRLNRRARVLTAEAQLSKWVLLALPLIMFVLLNVINPKYVAPLYSTFPGKVMLASGAVGMLIGAWVMNRMATLKY